MLIYRLNSYISLRGSVDEVKRVIAQVLQNKNLSKEQIKLISGEIPTNQDQDGDTIDNDDEMILSPLNEQSMSQKQSSKILKQRKTVSQKRNRSKSKGERINITTNETPLIDYINSH